MIEPLCAAARFAKFTPRPRTSSLSPHAPAEVAKTRINAAMEAGRSLRIGFTCTKAPLAVVLAVSLYWFLSVRGPIRSVAILPFVGSSTETEYLSDGITDTLIDNISRLPDL